MYSPFGSLTDSLLNPIWGVGFLDELSGPVLSPLAPKTQIDGISLNFLTDPSFFSLTPFQGTSKNLENINFTSGKPNPDRPLTILNLERGDIDLSQLALFYTQNLTGNLNFFTSLESREWSPLYGIASRNRNYSLKIVYNNDKLALENFNFKSERSGTLATFDLKSDFRFHSLKITTGTSELVPYFAKFKDNSLLGTQSNLTLSPHLKFQGEVRKEQATRQDKYGIIQFLPPFRATKLDFLPQVGYAYSENFKDELFVGLEITSTIFHVFLTTRPTFPSPLIEETNPQKERGFRSNFTLVPFKFLVINGEFLRVKNLLIRDYAHEELSFKRERKIQEVFSITPTVKFPLMFNIELALTYGGFYSHPQLAGLREQNGSLTLTLPIALRGGNIELSSMVSLLYFGPSSFSDELFFPILKLEGNFFKALHLNLNFINSFNNQGYIFKNYPLYGQRYQLEVTLLLWD